MPRLAPIFYVTASHNLNKDIRAKVHHSLYRHFLFLKAHSLQYLPFYVYEKRSCLKICFLGVAGWIPHSPWVHWMWPSPPDLRERARVGDTRLRYSKKGQFSTSQTAQARFVPGKKKPFAAPLLLWQTWNSGGRIRKTWAPSALRINLCSNPSPGLWLILFFSELLASWQYLFYPWQVKQSIYHKCSCRNSKVLAENMS